MADADLVESLCYVTNHAKIRIRDLLTINDPGIIGDLLEAIHLHIKTLVHQPAEKKSLRCYNDIVTVMKKSDGTNRAILITTFMPNKYLEQKGLRYGEIKYDNHEYSKIKEEPYLPAR